MNDTITNDYVYEELNTNYDNEKLEQVKKIVSINKNNFKSSRDFIVKSSTYTAEDKIIFLDILDTLNSVNRKKKLVTSNYDGKPYSLVFINEFFSFLNNPENSFSLREIKLLMAIYKIIAEANAYSNCLISCHKNFLAETAGIDKTNIGKIIKSLEKKKILKVDIHGSIYINCEYFFMGNSMNYDLYKIQYQNVEQ
ncbi:MAG TPA: replication/maintenance protein RepL [Paraburkholderia sp.]|uniref:replication/maintenance protein RepL n=1 Tax=Paraburkholderia sp. TaxID=1926495 RepID=UPI002ED2C847